MFEIVYNVNIGFGQTVTGRIKRSLNWRNNGRK